MVTFQDARRLALAHVADPAAEAAPEGLEDDRRFLVWAGDLRPDALGGIIACFVDKATGVVTTKAQALAMLESDGMTSVEVPGS